MATTLIIWPKLVYPMTFCFRVIYTLRQSLRHYIICQRSFLAENFLTQFVILYLTSENWENLAKVLPEVDFPFHEDNLKVKKITEKLVQKPNTTYLKADIDHGY